MKCNGLFVANSSWRHRAARSCVTTHCVWGVSVSTGRHHGCSQTRIEWIYATRTARHLCCVEWWVLSL